METEVLPGRDCPKSKKLSPEGLQQTEWKQKKIVRTRQTFAVDLNLLALSPPSGRHGASQGGCCLSVWRSGGYWIRSGYLARRGPCKTFEDGVQFTAADLQQDPGPRPCGNTSLFYGPLSTNSRWPYVCVCVFGKSPDKNEKHE